MDITEIKTVAYQITQLWINLLLNYNTINNKEQRFLSLLKHQSDIVFKYEDRALLDKAMECIPLQSLYEQAETRNPDSLDDQLIQCLLHWFKYEFFSWVDTLPCEQCGYKKTKMNGYVDPSSEDLRYGATRVETFFCTQCAHITRFPRYNDPGKLLETRKGRCGEWANCFTLCCRAIGFEARIVYDTADHVWTEIYSEYQQRWIHCDSCEDAWDKPLLYTTGWKKELAYCIASSVDEMVDVTKRYTLSLKNRYAVNERALALFLIEQTRKRQERMALERRKELNERSLRELMELEKPRVAQEEEGHGRISGSLTWRAMRGEAGASINIMKLLDSSSVRQKISVFKDQCSLLGSATLLDADKPIIRLTQTVSSQCGGSFYRHPISLKDFKGIQIEFKLRVTNRDGLSAVGGADGLAFVIHSDAENTLGRGGCELGYGGIKNSLAVEFDTYKGEDTCNDPSDNHISVQGRLSPLGNSSHHYDSLGCTSDIPTLQSGEWIRVNIRLLPDTIEIGLGEDDYISVLKIDHIPVLNYLGKERAWIGFTASTGGLSQNHDIQWIHLINL